MWGRMRLWIKDTGCLAIDGKLEKELREDLIKIEYGFDNKGRIQLEKKEDMKKRGVRSPDFGDALALTFALPVADPEHLRDHGNKWGTVQQKLEEIYAGSHGSSSWKVR